jgi:hypothetical protein
MVQLELKVCHFCISLILIDAMSSLGAAILKADIQDTRDMLTSLGINIPVGNSDAGSFFSTEILSSVDYGVSHDLSYSIHGNSEWW